MTGVLGKQELEGASSSPTEVPSVARPPPLGRFRLGRFGVRLPEVLELTWPAVVRLAEGMELHRSRVMGVNRIELSGFTEAAKDRLKADGFFSEIISWKLRLFCPTDPTGIAVLERLLVRCPVTGLHARGGC